MTMAGSKYRVVAARSTKRKPVGIAAGGASTGPEDGSVEDAAPEPVLGRMLEPRVVKPPEVSAVPKPLSKFDVELLAPLDGGALVEDAVGVVVVVVVEGVTGAGPECTAAVIPLSAL